MWSMFVPESSIGVLRFLVDDTGAPRNVVLAFVTLWFVADISQMTRGVKPRWSMLYALSGQVVLSLISLVYLLQGRTTLLGFTGQVGLLAVSALCVAIAAQRESGTYRFGIKARTFLVPTISVVLMLTVIGLVIRPDGPIANFIQNTQGLAYFVFVVFLLVAGAGATRVNHISAGGLFLAVLGYILFTAMFLGLFLSTVNMVSVTALVTHIGLTALLVTAAYLQTDAYEGV